MGALGNASLMLRGCDARRSPDRRALAASAAARIESARAPWSTLVTYDHPARRGAAPAKKDYTQRASGAAAAATRGRGQRRRNMLTLRSFVGGRWEEGTGTPQTLLNPATEEPLARAASEGIDLVAALDYARNNGGPALRSLAFAERGALLKAMAQAMQASRDALLDLAVANGGNTRSDAKFDVDGAIATLLAYADTGTALGGTQFLIDGEGIQLGRSPRFHGQHIVVPRHGVAVHVNAFNFPAWGFAEKAAVALLAGMPVLSKPATSSAMVAHRIMEILVEKKVLPDGALSLLAGSPRDLVSRLGA